MTRTPTKTAAAKPATPAKPAQIGSGPKAPRTKAMSKVAPPVEPVAPPGPPPPEVPLAPVGAPAGAPEGKLGVLVRLMRRDGGASVYDMAEAVGWQLHSVRGALAGALKQRGFVITSDKPDKVRTYRIVEPKPKTPRRRKGG